MQLVGKGLSGRKRNKRNSSPFLSFCIRGPRQAGSSWRLSSASGGQGLRALVGKQPGRKEEVKRYFSEAYGRDMGSEAAIVQHAQQEGCSLLAEPGFMEESLSLRVKNKAELFFFYTPPFVKRP